MQGPFVHALICLCAYVYWGVCGRKASLNHASQFVPDMSTDIRGHQVGKMGFGGKGVGVGWGSRVPMCVCLLTASMVLSVILTDV